MEHAQDYIIALSTVFSIFLLVWKMTGDMKRYCDTNINKVYNRFDEYKKHMEYTHVSKEVCGILHNQLVEDIVEIKSDVKKLLVKNGIT